MPTITVFSSEQYDSDWLPSNLKALITWLGERLEEIPEEHRDEASCALDTRQDYDSAYATCSISYTREYTQQELAQRELERRAAVGRQRQDDLLLLAQLRAKYPDLR